MEVLIKINKLGPIITTICLLVIANGICCQSVWGKSYQEENYQGVLEVAQWEPDEEHSETTPEPTPTPNVENESNNPVEAPTPKPIPTPTTELVPTIVPAPTETIAINPDDDLSSNQGTDNQGIDNQGTDNQVISNQNEQITGVKVVPVNMGRMFLVSIIAMVGLKLILFVGKRR